MTLFLFTLFASSDPLFNFHEWQVSRYFAPLYNAVSNKGISHDELLRYNDYVNKQSLLRCPFPTDQKTSFTIEQTRNCNDLASSIKVPFVMNWFLSFEKFRSPTVYNLFLNNKDAYSSDYLSVLWSYIDISGGNAYMTYFDEFIRTNVQETFDAMRNPSKLSNVKDFRAYIIYYLYRNNVNLEQIKDILKICNPQIKPEDFEYLTSRIEVSTEFSALIESNYK
eukprot:NODE_122_length_18870_cov_0.236908.p8 type:complete len:223 gc:universal NODE_122_length_18870_cov_0.236908:6333-5665(-)